MFCDICGRQTRFGVRNSTREINVHGVNIPVTYRAEVCSCCGEERYDDNLEIDLMKKAVALYCEQKKMISADRVQEYMEQHGLTAAEMAAKVDCAVSDIIGASHGGVMTTELNRKIKKAISA